MSERLTQNQRTAAGIALLIGAGVTPIGATLYAAEHRTEFEQPVQTPDSEVGPSASPSALPSPTLSPSSTELPNSKPQITLTPSPKPEVSESIPQALPIYQPPKTETKPESKDVPILPQPIFEPVTPLPKPQPTETSDTPTVDIEKPKPDEVEPRTITFETVPEAVSEIMSRDTVYLPAFGCSGSLIRNDQAEPIGFTTASHCGLILTDDINEKQYNRMTQKPIPGIDGVDYLVFPSGLDVQVGDSKDTLKTVGKYSEVLVPSVGDRSTDFAIGALEGYTIDEVAAAYQRNKTPEDVVKSLKLGDILYSSGWPVDQPGNPTKSIRRQEFAETYLGEMKDVYFGSGQTIRNMVVTVVKKNQDGAMCSPGKSGSKLFKFDPNSIDGRADTAIGTLTGGYWSIDNPGFAIELGLFAARFNVTLDPNEVAAVCMYSVDEPSLTSLKKPGTIIKSVVSPTEIPGYDKLYSRDAMLNQIKENLKDPDYSHSVIDGIVQTVELVEDPNEMIHVSNPGDTKGGGDVPNYKATFLDRPGVLYSPVTGAAVVYALDSNSPDGLKYEYYENLKYIAVFDRDSEAGINILQTEGAITNQPTKGVTDGFIDTNNLNFGQILENPTINYEDFYELYFDAYSNELTANKFYHEGDVITKGGGK